MGKQQVKSKKSRKSNPKNATQKEKNVQARLKKKQQQQQNQSNPLEDNDPILHESDDDGAEEEEKIAPEDLNLLLEPYSKEQLITLLTDAAADDPSLLSHIESVADHNIDHHKIFIRGIGWGVTTEALLEAFRPYGPIADCYAVVDKASGRSKGYGFVTFSTRSSAVKALKNPQKMIGSRMASCRLSSADVATSNSSQKGKLPITPVVHQSLPIINQQPALNAMAAAQSVAMLSQNQAYSTLFAQNPLFNNAAFNSNSFSALNPAALAALNPTANLVTPQGLGYGGQGLGGVGVGLGGSNVFGTYRTQESTGLSYGGSQLGQSSSLTPATGFFRSFPQ